MPWRNKPEMERRAVVQRLLITWWNVLGRPQRRNENLNYAWNKRIAAKIRWRSSKEASLTLKLLVFYGFLAERKIPKSWRSWTDYCFINQHYRWLEENKGFSLNSKSAGRDRCAELGPFFSFGSAREKWGLFVSMIQKENYVWLHRECLTWLLDAPDRCKRKRSQRLVPQIIAADQGLADRHLWGSNAGGDRHRALKVTEIFTVENGFVELPLCKGESVGMYSSTPWGTGYEYWLFLLTRTDIWIIRSTILTWGQTSEIEKEILHVLREGSSYWDPIVLRRAINLILIQHDIFFNIQRF